MSRRFWMGLLRKAVAKLLGIHWEDVKASVLMLMSSELSGEEKRRLVLAHLQDIGVDVATWLLSAAIEVAYGEIKEVIVRENP